MSAASTPNPARRRRRRIWLVLAAVTVLVIGGVEAWWLLRPGQSVAQSFTRDVQVTRGTQTRTVALDGTLSPRKQSEVDFQVSGTVTSVRVTAGQAVTKGQRLAAVDDDALSAAVDLAKAQVSTAEANLDDVEDDGSDAAIAAARAQVSSATAALANARQNLAGAILRSPIDGTVASVGVEVGDTVGGSSAAGSGSDTTTAPPSW